VFDNSDIGTPKLLNDLGNVPFLLSRKHRHHVRTDLAQKTLNQVICDFCETLSFTVDFNAGTVGWL